MTLDIGKLKEIYQKEKSVGFPYKIPSTFYEEYSDYLKQLGDDERSFYERKNAERLFKSIVELRFTKIARMAISGVSQYEEFLTPCEKDLLNDMKALNQFYKRDKRELVKVRMLDDIPTYTNYGTGRSYGPFKKGEIYELPADEAQFLVKANKAVRV